jgi:hypothetical protein
MNGCDNYKATRWVRKKKAAGEGQGACVIHFMRAKSPSEIDLPSFPANRGLG